MASDQREIKSPSLFGPGGGPKFGPGRHFVGVVVKPENPAKTMKRLWRYLRLYKWRFILAFFLTGVSSLAMLFGPYLIGKAIDDYIIPRDFQGLWHLLTLMLALYGLGSLFVWLQSYLMTHAVQRSIARLRNDLFDVLQVLPLRFFDTHPHGDLMSRLTNDIDVLSNVLSNTITQMLSGVITIVGTVVAMVRMSPRLTVVSLVGIPLTLLVIRLVTRYTRESFLAQQTILGNLNGVIEENISGLRVVKAFCRESREIERFEQMNQELQKVGTKAQIYSGVIGPLMNVINNLSLAIIAGFGGWFAIQGTVSVGVIASFITYSRQFTRPLNELANQFNMFQSAIASAERVFQIMDEQPEPLDVEDALELKEVWGEVEFQDV
ncbi:MAG: ABC transporter ATP-binding protein, partial [Candidatus Caldatribacteriaceae bacterium]